MSINDIRKRIKLLKNQLAIESLKLEKAIADVLEPTVCCNAIYEKISEYEKHRMTKKCMINRNIPNFRCKICNKRFFDGVSSLNELLNDNILYSKSTYRKHINPINNPHHCKTYCDICDVPLESLYMAQKHKNCIKPSTPQCSTSTHKKCKSRSKIQMETSDDSSEDGSEDDSSLDHLVYVKIKGYQYTHNNITDAMYDDLDEYQGQAVKDDMDNIYDVDRTFDKPPKKKSSVKVI